MSGNLSELIAGLEEISRPDNSNDKLYDSLDQFKRVLRKHAIDVITKEGKVIKCIPGTMAQSQVSPEEYSTWGKYTMAGTIYLGGVDNIISGVSQQVEDITSKRSQTFDIAQFMSYTPMLRVIADTAVRLFKSEDGNK